MTDRRSFFSMLFGALAAAVGSLLPTRKRIPMVTYKYHGSDANVVRLAQKFAATAQAGHIFTLPAHTNANVAPLRLNVIEVQY